MGRHGFLEENIRDRNLFDSDKGRLVLLFGNEVAGGFFDSEKKPLRGRLDRSKFSFSVDVGKMEKFFKAKGFRFDVPALVQEFEAAMRA